MENKIFTDHRKGEGLYFYIKRLSIAKLFGSYSASLFIKEKRDNILKGRSFTRNIWPDKNPHLSTPNKKTP